jgi:hypothetical protein
VKKNFEKFSRILKKITMNLKKSEDSNQRRLEALSRQADEFKQKKSQIRSDLLNLVNKLFFGTSGNLVLRNFTG